MFYKKYTPHPRLCPFVECYYIWEIDASNKQLCIESPPAAFSSIVINYGETYQTSTINNQSKITAPQYFITGQSTTRFQLYLQNSIRCAGIVFKPAGLNSLFQIPMSEFVDERVDLDAVLPGQIPLLAEQIAEATGPGHRKQLMEQFLLRQVQKKDIQPNFLDWAANAIVSSKGTISMDNLMENVFMSNRQFQRQFLKKVGVSPKYYARIRRIGTLCNELVHSESVDWPQLFYAYGFYDQAHFIRDFKNFMGTSPEKYWKNNTELVNFIKQEELVLSDE